MQEKKILSLDIGGSFIKWAIFDFDLKIIKKDKFQTHHSPKNPDGTLMWKKVVSWINDEIRSNYNLAYIAVSTSGVIDEQGQVIGSTPAFTNYIDFNIKTFLSSKTNLPVFVENDANCAILGELFLGVINGSTNSVMIVLGTGIGGGLIVEKEIFKGAHGWGGEVGRMLLPSGKEWEQVASTKNLLKQMQKAGFNFEHGVEIFANLYNPGVWIVFQKYLDDLAWGIVNICYLFDPEIFVIGGGIIENKLFPFDKLVTIIESKMDKNLFLKINFKQAKLGNAANLVGAAALGLKKWTE